MYPDNRCYKGHFKNGLQHGIGIFIIPNGKERKGEWKDGIRVRWMDERENNA